MKQLAPDFAKLIGIGLLALPAPHSSAADAADCKADNCMRPPADAIPTARPATVALYGKSAVRPDLLRDPDAGAESEWRNNMVARNNQENLDCPLSFGIGGDLSAKGYKGLRLFGATHTLSRPAGKEAP